MMIADFTIEAERLWPGEVIHDGLLAFVDLDRAPTDYAEIVLPPCPVIGIGGSAHPLAVSLDAVIESPIRAETLAQQVLAMPNAAAVIVQLLRILPALSAEAGLAAESLAYAVLQGSEEHARWISERGGQPSKERAPGKVALERGENSLTITLDSPDTGNTIDRNMRDQLYDALSLAALDPSLARISLRAAGRTFSLGADLDEFGTTTDPATAHAIRRLTLPAIQASRCAERLDVHVAGGCVGAGLELAAWAERFTAASNAWFQLPELSMGILPGAGGCVSLSRRIGRQRAALLVLSGKRLNARDALAWGLIDAIVDDST